VKNPRECKEDSAPRNKDRKEKELRIILEIEKTRGQGTMTSPRIK
jgi:hypothetical protein